MSFTHPTKGPLSFPQRDSVQRNKPREAGSPDVGSAPGVTPSLALWGSVSPNSDKGVSRLHSSYDEEHEEADT